MLSNLPKGDDAVAIEIAGIASPPSVFLAAQPWPWPRTAFPMPSFLRPCVAGIGYNLW